MKNTNITEKFYDNIDFRYKYKNVEDGKWGHIEAGSSGKEWNGMVAQVMIYCKNTYVKSSYSGCLGRC